MIRIRLTLSYDGTDFCGWQKQGPNVAPEHKPSVQQTLEEALSKLFNEPISVNGSGRTDAGVHAVGQVCDFSLSRENKLPKDFCWAIRSFLPSSMVVKKAFVAPEEFHSLHSATHKTYCYWIWNRPTPTALLSRYSHWIRHPLDLEHLNRQTQFLIGEHDFKSFQSAGTPITDTVRTIQSAGWQLKKNGLVQFRVTGDGFLKQMVRNIVGTQLDLAMKSQDPEIIENIVNFKDRRKAGPTAPGQGLFLWRVYYPQALDNKCRRI